MARFLIELKHSDEHDGCVRALEAIERYGSHYMTHADWGCKDGTHCSWLIVDLDTREEAVRMVPVGFREEARIVMLNRFTKDEIASLVESLND